MKKLNKVKVLGLVFALSWTITMARYAGERDWRAVILLLTLGVAWAAFLYLVALTDRYRALVDQQQETIREQVGRLTDREKTIFDLISNARAKEILLAHGAVAVVGAPVILEQFIRGIEPNQRGKYHLVSDARDLEGVRGLRLVKVILLKGHDSVNRDWPGLLNYLYSRVG